MLEHLMRAELLQVRKKAFLVLTAVSAAICALTISFASALPASAATVKSAAVTSATVESAPEECVLGYCQYELFGTRDACLEAVRNIENGSIYTAYCVEVTEGELFDWELIIH